MIKQSCLCKNFDQKLTKKKSLVENQDHILPEINGIFLAYFLLDDGKILLEKSFRNNSLPINQSNINKSTRITQNRYIIYGVLGLSLKIYKAQKIKDKI